MKERIKLPLAMVLALGSANALALGLGPIQVKSGLNQPLVAEIQVNGSADETAGLAVSLASSEDFARVGLSRARVGTPLEFNVVPGGKGVVIRISTKDAVHDPFLDFLLEVNWAKGKLLREYTVLLDPPVTAPAVKGSSAKMAPVKETATAASTKPLDTTPSKPSRPPRTETTPTSTAAAPSKPAPRAAQSGEYGPVNTGEALWDIANATRPDDSVSVNQMMLALLRSNPSAFYQNNINSLKRGAILRVPSSEEVKAASSAAAAAAEVKSQVDAWRSGSAVSKPTLVADTGTPASTSKPSTSATASTSKPGDKLALIPPKAGTGGQSTGEKPGASGGTGDPGAKAELARTKEALASREQESGELKSRVKELEELKTKNERLLNLKDSEMAELQKKLKELQDKASKPSTSVTATPTTTVTTPTTTTATPSTTTTATATPSTSMSSTATPSSSTSTKPATTGGNGLTKEDIWGSASSDKPSTTPSTSTTSTPSSTSTPSTTTTATPTTSSTSTTPSTSTSSPSTTVTSTPSTTTPATTATPTPGDTSSSSSTPSSTSSTPTTTTPATTATPSSTTTPAKPVTPAKVQPLPTPAPEEPWYKKTWILAAAGLGLLIIVVLGLLNFLRRPKAAGTVPPLPSMSDLHDEEHELLDRLALQPDETAAHLELVSLYYARQEVDKFEASAQAMYAHLGDAEAAEWEQVKAMGMELAPHNPLFAEDVHGHSHYEAQAHHQDTTAFDAFEDIHSQVAPPPSHADDAFDFDLTDHSAAAKPAAVKPPPVDNFTLNMPSMDFDRTPHVEPVRMPEPAAPAMPPPSRIDDDFAIGGDDATGTKLDLAKAYLDMGDPEGARSMLEEVVAEGNAAQKAEANRLIKELR
jgi:pilus assembly protein FimV